VSRFWDPKISMWVVQVLPGELYTTDQDEVIATVLGSCVSTCVRVARLQIGGINHFMLPHAPRGTADDEASARYGVSALERLLNGMMSRGARRSELEVKVFGGGRVIEGGSDVGRANIDFVRGFFAAEHLEIVAEDVGDQVARRLRYWPRSGRVQLLRMPMSRAERVLAAEARAKATTPAAGSVELF
jgi:chemotaxis protein CheD